MTDEIKIALPDDIIQEHIKIAVAQAVTLGNPGKLVEEFVKQALTEHDRYSRETTWSKTLKSQIEELAKEVLAEWVKQNKEAIKAALERELKRSKNKLVKALADGVISNASQYSLGVTFNINPPKARY